MLVPIYCEGIDDVVASRPASVAARRFVRVQLARPQVASGSKVGRMYI
jgi:hypothetical protein